MSVDRRLREGLRAAAEEVHTSGYEAYEAVAVGARRRQVRMRARNAAVVLTAAAALVAAYFIVGAPALQTTKTTPPATQVTTPAPTQSVSSPVEGTWQAGPLPMSVIVAYLKAHQLEKWTAAYLGTNTGTTQFTFTLKLQDGQLTLTKALDGVSQGVEDSERFSVTGNRIRFSPDNDGCATTFGWQVTGDQLVLTFVSDTCPPYQGTPDEVFMRALYASTPYTSFTP